MKIGIVALGFLVLAPAGLAQIYPGSGEQDASERAAMVKGLERGKSMKGSRDQYRLLPQVSAVSLANPSEQPEQATARIGEGGAQIVEKKGNLVLYRSSQTKPASVGRAGTVSVYPTVVNARTETLGVLTGALIVKPKNMADAEAIASSRGLEVSKTYAHIRTVFYEVKPGVDIADVSAALQADPRVESAYPEIIEHVRVPQ